MIKRILLGLFLSTLLCLEAYAGGIIRLDLTTASGKSYSDSFGDATLTWVEMYIPDEPLYSTWAETAGVLRNTQAATGRWYIAGYSATDDDTLDPTDTFSQWQCVRIPALPSSRLAGFVFYMARTINTTDNAFYIINDGGTVYMGEISDETVANTEQEVAFDTGAGCSAIAAGDSFCASVTWAGAGQNISASYYRFANQDPPAKGSWGTACRTLSFNPVTDPTAKGLGVLVYRADGTSNSVDFDVWSGGDL